MSLDAPEDLSIPGDGLRIAVIAARFNQARVDEMLGRVHEVIAEAGAKAACVERVPGSAELPFAASTIARTGIADAVIVLGVVIAGQTDHHRVIGDSTATALQHIAQETGVPVINGILVVDSEEQARQRTGPGIDRGGEFARSAIEMAHFRKEWMKKTQ